MHIVNGSVGSSGGASLRRRPFPPLTTARPQTAFVRPPLVNEFVFQLILLCVDYEQTNISCMFSWQGIVNIALHLLFQGQPSVASSMLYQAKSVQTATQTGDMFECTMQIVQETHPSLVILENPNGIKQFIKDIEQRLRRPGGRDGLSEDIDFDMYT